jgi:hypothetical protein
MMKITEKITLRLLSIGILLTVVLSACTPHYYYLRTAGEPITLERIITFAGEGLTDREMIKRIDESGMVFFLRTDDILRLYNNGVNKPVIDHLITIKEWTLMGSPGIYNDIYPERVYQVPRSYRDTHHTRSLVPIAVH